MIHSSCERVGGSVRVNKGTTQTIAIEIEERKKREREKHTKAIRGVIQALEIEVSEEKNELWRDSFLKLRTLSLSLIVTSCGSKADVLRTTRPAFLFFTPRSFKKKLVSQSVSHDLAPDR